MNSIIPDLIKILYDKHCTGGPLHIVLDDRNFDDGALIFCYQEAQKEKWKEVRELCLAILHELMMLTEDERKSIIEY